MEFVIFLILGGITVSILMSIFPSFGDWIAGKPRKKKHD
jgi:hypothetical protein